MSNLAIFIDYENFHVASINQHSIEVSEKGIEYLIKKCCKYGTMSSKQNLVVAAFWDNFKKQKQLFSNKFAEIVDVYEKGSNISDGYLIVNAMKKINSLTAGDHVVIVAGDGVYAGLIRHCLSLDLIVHVYSWKPCTSDALKFDGNVDINNLEDIYDFSANNHLNNGYFLLTGVTQAEYAIISRALRPEFPHLFKIATANILYQNTTDERYKDINTFKNAIDFLETCENNSIFIAERKPNPEKENKSQIAYTLNTDNPKVQSVIAKEVN
jgi:hypothetical protein